MAGRVKLLRPEIRVVYMSGYAADVISQRGLLDPGVQYIAKPFCGMLWRLASAKPSTSRSPLRLSGLPGAIIRIPMAPEDSRALIEAFLKNSRQPALLEPGEDLLPMAAENFALDVRGSRLTLQVWDRTRNLTRRITKAEESAAGRLELTVERFARRQGQAFLLDLARPSGAEWAAAAGDWSFANASACFCGASFRSGR